MAFITDKISINKNEVSSYYLDVSGNVNIDSSLYLGQQVLGNIVFKNYWSGTQSAYDSLGTYDSSTIYFIS